MSELAKKVGYGMGTAVLGIALAGGVCGVAAPRTLLAQGRGADSQGGPGRTGPGGRMDWGSGGILGGLMLERLNLTDAQKGQVKSILDTHRSDLQAVGERLGTARRGLEAAIAADVIDENAIRTKAADVAAVQADMAVLRARIRAEVVQILTADQQKALKEQQGQGRRRDHHRQHI